MTFKHELEEDLKRYSVRMKNTIGRGRRYRVKCKSDAFEKEKKNSEREKQGLKGRLGRQVGARILPQVQSEAKVNKG